MELIPGDEHPLAKCIRDAIGVGNYDPVEVIGPQFERPDGKNVTFIPDKTIEFFDQLRKAPRDILIDIGMGPWDDNLLLFPHEWYDFIPEGYKVWTILETEEEFKHGTSCDDKRCGCLAYGFKL